MSELMNPDLALSRLLAQAIPVSDSETLATEQALGQILSEPVIAGVTVPPADNSAVDGYALRWQDAKTDLPIPLSQRIPAGHDPQPLGPGTAARIFTGATVPSGADTVLMQEHCEEGDSGNHVILKKAPEQGQNIRPAGQDIRAGESLLAEGTRLGPQHLGLLASVGLAEVPVRRRLKVAILCTGDELIPPGQPLTPGKIYNSNRYTLQGLLQAAGCQILDLGDVADTFEATCDALKKGAAGADLVISTGGVSVGDEDHVRAAVQALGRLDLWRLAIKPGKPFAYGEVAGTPFVGLPGNPAAVLVTFLVLVAPYLRRCQGIAGNTGAHSYPVPLGFAVEKATHRRDFRRVRYHRSDHESWLEEAPNQSSGMLSSACWADGLALIPENRTLARGDSVDYFPFNELLHG